MRRASALLPPRRAPGAPAAASAASTAGAAAPAQAARAASGAGLSEALLAAVPDGVAVLGREGSVERWSAAAERLTGRRLGWLRRAGFLALFPDPHAVQQALAAAGEQAAPVEVECVLQHADGREVPVRLHAVAQAAAVPAGAAAAGAEGGPGTRVVVLEDLSEVQTIRQRLIETEKLSAMAKVAGSIAHEFRNPLNSLFLSADLLEDELGSAGTASESVTATLGAVREEIERLNQIITHYLALSKIGGSQRETVDLTRVASAFVAEQRERAAARGATLGLQASSGACLVHADRHQLRRVLLNLLDNALDAVEAHAPARKAPGRITISVRRGPDGARLVVRDNGPGVPASVRERPFEPFRSTKPRGAGLGLYLVREIVSAHGGSIALLDVAGGGARAVVRLPLAPPRRSRGRR